MYNDKLNMYEACGDDPTLIFTLIKKGYFDVINELIDEKKIDANLCDSVGNDVCMRLLKAKQYDLVIKLMKKRNWDVNHQNEVGDTFGHILALDNDIRSLKVIDQLIKKKNYSPNINNSNGDTSFDVAINNNYLISAIKFLEDKRFDNIGIGSFKKLYKVSIKNSTYGKYSKINNLKIIVDSLDKKDLSIEIRDVVDKINDNMESIKEDLLRDSNRYLDNIINNSILRTA